MATILIIDDDPDTRSVLETFLAARGHDVQGAARGSAALAALDDIDPELVILDVMMPDMDGWEVARRIRARPRHAGTRIIMQTARDSRADRREGLAAGADVYLVKPVRLEELGERVDSVLAAPPGA